MTDVWKQYQRKGLSEMRPYVPGEDLGGISVAEVDTPEEGGMIARNPDNPADQWYVAKDYFEKNLEEAIEPISDLATGFGIGVAIQAMLEGKRVARTGWNGKGMFLFFNPGSSVPVSEGRPLSFALAPGSSVRMLPYIMMKTANPDQTECVPWLASQTDLLATDWEVCL